MNSPAKLHPVLWVAAVAVIVLSLAGVGAIMGVIPSVGSKSSDATQAGQQPPAAAAPANLATAPETAAPAAAPAPAPTEHKHRSTRHTTAGQAPGAMAQAAPPPPPTCRECGTVEAVHQVEVKGEGTGLGAVGGAVVGGLLGNQVGQGHGRDAMTVLGAVGGGLAGNQIEKNVRKKVRYDVVVRFDDGTTHTYSSEQAPSWRSGDRVRLSNGQLVPLN